MGKRGHVPGTCVSRHCVEVGLDGDARCGYECGQVRTTKSSLIGKEAVREIWQGFWEKWELGQNVVHLFELAPPFLPIALPSILSSPSPSFLPSLPPFLLPSLPPFLPQIHFPVTLCQELYYAMEV